MHDRYPMEERRHMHAADAILMAESTTAQPDPDPDTRAQGLLKDLFKFVLHSDRIFFVEDIEIWKHFHSVRDNAIKYGHISAEELCELFVNDLLPCLDRLELPIKIKKHCELLDLHPQFKRSEEGYTRLPPSERIGGHFHAASLLQNDQENQSNNNYVKTRPDKETLKKPFVLVESFGGGATSSHIKVVDESVQHASKHFQISPANAALLSAMLAANNQEMVSCALVDPSKVHERLQLAKYKFEKRGQFLPYLNGDELLAQVGRIKSLREALVSVISKRFFYN